MKIEVNCCNVKKLDLKFYGIEKPRCKVVLKYKDHEYTRETPSASGSNLNKSASALTRSGRPASGGWKFWLARRSLSSCVEVEQRPRELRAQRQSRAKQIR